MEASMGVDVVDRWDAWDQGPPAAPAQGKCYLCTLWVRVGCQRGRAHCGVEVPNGSMVPSGGGILHGDKFYGSLRNFHGSKSSLYGSIFASTDVDEIFHVFFWKFPWKFLSTSMEEVVSLPRNYFFFQIFNPWMQKHFHHGSAFYLHEFHGKFHVSNFKHRIIWEVTTVPRIHNRCNNFHKKMWNPRSPFWKNTNTSKSIIHTAR